MPRDLFGDMAEASMAFLREMCPEDGYYVAFSGGKDSVVILDLVRRAGVPHDTHYNITNVDPPELVQFIKRHYPGVERHHPSESMWAIIERNAMMPSRRCRFCCRLLKEVAGSGRTVVTGIRADESAARRARGPVEGSTADPTKRFVHPILNWSSDDVWGYIRGRGLPYCHLYDEGFLRLGCVICPFERDTARAQRRWPKLFDAARRALRRGWATRTQPTDWGPAQRFADADALFDWWLSRDEPYPEPQRTCGGLFV